MPAWNFLVADANCVDAHNRPVVDIRPGVTGLGEASMISEKACLLEDEVRLYWEVSSAAAVSSRWPGTKRAREDVEDLHMHALYGTTERLRASAERAIRAIAESPVSVRSARRAAKVALADLAPRPMMGTTAVAATADVPAPPSHTS
jgi:hypothetical protein